LSTDRGGLGTNLSNPEDSSSYARRSGFTIEHRLRERVMGKKLNWSASKRRKVARALSIKTENERMKHDAATKWLKKAEQREAIQRMR
jgi:hypothetical protein